MRSVWFALIGPSVPEARDWLVRHGIVPVDRYPGEYAYPSADNPVLFVSCEDYAWVQKYELEEEYEELLRAIDGAVPTAHVSARVSGRVPGDPEVRFLAQCLLGKFHGFAFDDFSSYSHAWTLDEINRGTLVDGLGFFDYQGHHNRSRS